MILGDGDWVVMVGVPGAADVDGMNCGGRGANVCGDNECGAGGCGIVVATGVASLLVGAGSYILRLAAVLFLIG